MYLAPRVPIAPARVPLASGRAGIWQTVACMRSMVDHFKVDPEIIQAATSIIFLQPERDEIAEARALFEHVRDRVRYVRDVLNVETLATPDKTLGRNAGDCDDQATALATLLEAVGYPTRFVVAGYASHEFEHVYLQALIAGQWVDMDPTERRPMGWAPPDPLIYALEA